MLKKRLKLALQNAIIFGGLYTSIYYASGESVKNIIFSLLALLVATLGSLSIVYKKKEVYHMVYTDEATDEDRAEGAVYTEPRPNYFKGALNYFLYGFGAVYASGTIIHFDLTIISILIFVASVIVMVGTRYDFKKHTPVMVFEDMTIQFVLFTGLALIVKASTSNTLDVLTAVTLAIGVLMFISMLLYRYHTVTYYRYKKTKKLPKNTNRMICFYGLSLSAFLVGLGVCTNGLISFIFAILTPLLLVASLLFFRTDTLPSVKDIL